MFSCTACASIWIGGARGCVLVICAHVYVYGKVRGSLACRCNHRRAGQSMSSVTAWGWLAKNCGACFFCFCLCFCLCFWSSSVVGNKRGRSARMIQSCKPLMFHNAQTVIPGSHTCQALLAISKILSTLSVWPMKAAAEQAWVRKNSSVRRHCVQVCVCISRV